RNAIARNLPRKTGRKLEQWLDVLRGAPAGKRKERVDWLKHEHRLGHVQASMIVDSADRPELFEQDPEALVDAQYADRADLRPLYERLRTEMLGLGEVEVTPRTTYVAFTHGRQFALVQPAKDRV